MNLNEILVILRSYPAFDIDRPDGTNLRKQVRPGADMEDIIRSYAGIYGRIRIIPKRKQGSAYVRDLSSIMEYGQSAEQSLPLSGVSGVPFSVPSTGESASELYRIMWENEKQNAREYREKYEKTLDELRKLEIEHASSKNDVIGNVVGGLAGVVPSLIAGSQVPALGSAPAQPQNLQPVTDKRLVGIVNFYNKLDDENKIKVYSLLVKIFQNLQKIDDIIALID